MLSKLQKPLSECNLKEFSNITSDFLIPVFDGENYIIVTD